MNIWPFKKEKSAFFSKAEEKQIVDAIRQSEKKTSGEIRLHIEATCHKNPYERALELFKELKMYQTKEKNAVLFYLAKESQLFAIVGDTGIHKKVGAEFWEKIKNECITHFKNNELAKGIEQGVLHCGEALQQFFPYQKDDTNELDNTISYGK